jgi:cysteine desulfurase
MKRIYLDNNATTKPFPEVVETVAYHLECHYGNPGSRHFEGQVARKALEEARESIAAILGADPSEVIFTSGGTESTNIALFGFAEQSEPGTILLTAGEHPATIESCQHLVKQGWKLHMLDVDSEGLLISSQFEALPWNEIKLATVILAHNETGVVQNLKPLAEKCREHQVPFHIDAVQTVGKLPVQFHDLGATSLALGAHKFHGPRGIGALLLKKGVNLAPVQFGGHQEAGRRPGTEPVALIAGMAKALEIFHADREQRIQTIRAMRDRLELGLRETCSPVAINGSREKRLPNTLNIAFPGLEGEALLVNLDLEGIACSLGSTCASGSAEPAPVLMAMGCPEEIYTASVRLSVSIQNAEEEIDEAVRRISKVVTRMRRTAVPPA